MFCSPQTEVLRREIVHLSAAATLDPKNTALLIWLCQGRLHEITCRIGSIPKCAKFGKIAVKLCCYLG